MFGLATAVAALTAIADEPAPRTAADGLTYTSDVRATPRPLRIHVLKLDLASPRYEPVVIVTDDPDGAGPAEAALASPEALATDAGLVAAVNAAIFGGLPDAEGKRSSQWTVGMPVDIIGWSRADCRERSPAERPYPALWIDETRRAGIAPAGVPAPEEARHAAAGFGLILRDGKIVAGPGGAMHPRTAAGLDRDRTTLILLVVDGRQEGVSEGVTDHELAGLMQEQGCHEAVNLDGGGSSVMLVGDVQGAAATGGRGLRVVNSPSDGAPRPLPAVIGVRRARSTQSPRRKPAG